jgi:hypothetical protein
MRYQPVTLVTILTYLEDVSSIFSKEEDNTYRIADPVATMRQDSSGISTITGPTVQHTE